MKLLMVFFLIFSSQLAMGQDNSDAKRLGRLEYMKDKHLIDCDNSTGTSLESRICLNLEFQKLDSIMNVRFVELLDYSVGDSIKTRFKSFQKAWVENRRLQSMLMSEGYSGHMLGIVYLHCMNAATRSRIQELEAILREE